MNATSLVTLDDVREFAGVVQSLQIRLGTEGKGPVSQFPDVVRDINHFRREARKSYSSAEILAAELQGAVEASVRLAGRK